MCIGGKLRTSHRRVKSTIEEPKCNHKDGVNQHFHICGRDYFGVSTPSYPGEMANFRLI